jgi:hypothetical protein
MDSPTTYKQYKVKNREFVFDVDLLFVVLFCGVLTGLLMAGLAVPAYGASRAYLLLFAGLAIALPGPSHAGHARAHPEVEASSFHRSRSHRGPGGSRASPSRLAAAIAIPGARKSRSPSFPPVLGRAVAPCFCWPAFIRR